jgi:hypothetical protein
LSRISLIFPVHDLIYFRTDRLNPSTFLWGSMKERLRHAAAAVAGAHTQIAMSVRKPSELRFVGTPHFCATPHSVYLPG